MASMRLKRSQFRTLPYCRNKKVECFERDGRQSEYFLSRAYFLQSNNKFYGTSDASLMETKLHRAFFSNQFSPDNNFGYI